MDDDFNTARAAGVLFDLTRDGNRLLQEARQSAPSLGTVTALEATAGLIRRLGSVLALGLTEASVDVSAASAVGITGSVEAARAELDRLLATKPPYPVEFRAQLTDVLRELLALREAARKRRAWAEADEIRQTLIVSGVRVDDTRTACHATLEFSQDRGLSAVSVSLVKE
jgi:cysteinyl-tRNA synthetase